MTPIRIKPIRLTNLLLNQDNPRFDPVTHQREALDSVVSTKVLRDKARYLAQDIIEAGVNPAELIIVAAAIDNKHKVLEGNRRVAVLKLLANPEIFKDKHKAFTKQMKKLSNEFRKAPIKTIQCVIITDESAANRWIKLKHTGENKGRGTVTWDAQQVARFDSRVADKSSVGLQAIDFVKGFADSALLAKIKHVSITNLERLLTDKNIQTVLGVTIEDGLLRTDLLREEVKKGLHKVVSDIAEKKLKVKDIYTKEDRKEYIEDFKPKVDIPDNKKKAENVWSLSQGEPQKPTKQKSKQKPEPLSTDRTAIIPQRCVLTIKPPKINKIYTELKYLNVDEFTNAGGVLFRVFLEMSVDVFIDKHGIPKVRKKDGRPLSLREKLNNVEKYMQSSGMATKPELKAVRIMAQTRDSIYSVDTFNDYVHNRHFSPDSKELKTIWDNIQVFFEKLWSNV